MLTYSLLLFQFRERRKFFAKDIAQTDFTLEVEEFESILFLTTPNKTMLFKQIPKELTDIGSPRPTRRRQARL